jgi:hypothetical protein
LCFNYREVFEKSEGARSKKGTGAKLLIEALSGRWSYDTDRREKEPFGTTSPTRFLWLLPAFTLERARLKTSR